jgi:hypothetical protein
MCVYGDMERSLCSVLGGQFGILFGVIAYNWIDVLTNDYSVHLLLRGNSPSTLDLCPGTDLLE